MYSTCATRTMRKHFNWLDGVAIISCFFFFHVSLFRLGRRTSFVLLKNLHDEMILTKA